MAFKKLFQSWLKSENPKDSSEIFLKDVLSDWVKNIEHYANPPKEIEALNFGLFESDKGFMIYLTGSEKYNASDDDWACQIDYEPIELYKYLLLKGNEITSSLKWEDISDLICKDLKEITIENADHALFKNRIVTTGFDSGDLLVIKN